MDIFFSTTIAIIAGIFFPGPDIILCSIVSINKGFRRGLAVAMGIATACCIWYVLLMFGVKGLFMKYPRYTRIFESIGLIYISIIAFNVFRKSLNAILHRKDIFEAQPVILKIASSGKHLFFVGLINCLLNPSVAFFYAPIFGQIVVTYSSIIFLVLYFIWFIGLHVICFGFIAWLFAFFRDSVKKFLKFVNLFLSGVLIYFVMQYIYHFIFAVH